MPRSNSYYLGVEDAKMEIMDWCQINVECHADEEQMLVDYIPWSRLRDKLEGLT